MEKAMAPHSSTLAWRIPWMEEPGRLVSKSPTQLSDFTFTFHFHALEKEMQPTPVFLPGGSQGRGSLVGCHLWSRTQLKRLRSSSSIHDESFFSCCFQDLLFVFVQFNSDMSRYGSFLYLKIIYFRFIDSLECLN